jgi:flagellar protein FlbD
MILLTRLNKERIYLNPDLIKTIEETPDTIISLVNNDHYLVREKAEEVVEKILVFRAALLHRSNNPIELCNSTFKNDEQ